VGVHSLEKKEGGKDRKPRSTKSEGKVRKKKKEIASKLA